ncbi:MAG: TetR/AcrR family transcriptional regulator [Bacilli bacterium]
MTRKEQRERTKRQLFDAALRLFRERGSSQTSVEDIARAVGVAKGTFFVHFPTKDAVFQAYVDMVTEDLRPELEGWLSMAPMDALADVFGRLTARAEVDRAFVGDVIRAELFGEPLDDGRPSALQEILLPLLRRLREGGDMRPDVSDDAAAQHLLSCYLIHIAWAWRRGESFESAMGSVLCVAFQGLRP